MELPSAAAAAGAASAAAAAAEGALASGSSSSSLLILLLPLFGPPTFFKLLFCGLVLCFITSVLIRYLTIIHLRQQQQVLRAAATATDAAATRNVAAGQLATAAAAALENISFYRDSALLAVLVKDAATNVLRKFLLLLYAGFFLCFSYEERGLQEAIARQRMQVQDAHNIQRQSVIFIRHGESVWNATFNRPLLTLTFPLRFVLFWLWELFLAPEKDSVLFDSPLSTAGIAQAAELRVSLRDEPHLFFSTPARTCRLNNTSACPLCKYDANTACSTSSCFSNRNTRTHSSSHRCACGGMRGHQMLCNKRTIGQQDSINTHCTSCCCTSSSNGVENNRSNNNCEDFVACNEVLSCVNKCFNNDASCGSGSSLANNNGSSASASASNSSSNSCDENNVECKGLPSSNYNSIQRSSSGIVEVVTGCRRKNEAVGKSIWRNTHVSPPYSVTNECKPATQAASIESIELQQYGRQHYQQEQQYQDQQDELQKEKQQNLEHVNERRQCTFESCCHEDTEVHVPPLTRKGYASATPANVICAVEAAAAAAPIRKKNPSTAAVVHTTPVAVADTTAAAAAPATAAVADRTDTANVDTITNAGIAGPATVAAASSDDAAGANTASSAAWSNNVMLWKQSCTSMSPCHQHFADRRVGYGASARRRSGSTSRMQRLHESERTEREIDVEKPVKTVDKKKEDAAAFLSSTLENHGLGAAGEQGLSGAGHVVLVSSNLRRSLSTLFIALGPAVHRHVQPVRVLSCLQEATRFPDALSLCSPASLSPVSLFRPRQVAATFATEDSTSSAAWRHTGVGAGTATVGGLATTKRGGGGAPPVSQLEETVLGSSIVQLYGSHLNQASNKGNKWICSTVVSRLQEFAAWLFHKNEAVSASGATHRSTFAAASTAPVVVVVGHSRWLRYFFEMYYPPDLQYPAKTMKLTNCGVLKFDVLRLYQKDCGRVDYLIDPLSCQLLRGGFFS